MRIVVTGSNGFIGQNTCRALVERGEEVIGVDDLSTGIGKPVADGVRYHVHKIEDEAWLTALLRDTRPQAIIHLAAAARVAASVRHPRKNAEVNVIGTLSVLSAIREADLLGSTRVVFASSSSVYGDTDVLPTPETHPCRPQSPYALAKLQCEQWCAMFHRLYGLDVVSLRYFNVYGPGARFGGAYSTVIPAWLHSLCVDPECPPFLEGDGEQTRDFSYVDDVVAANIAAATRAEPFAAEVMNIGGGASYSLLRLRKEIEGAAGQELRLECRPPRVGDVRHTNADIGRAQKAIGYNPNTDLTTGIVRTVAWYREVQPEFIS